LRRGALDTCCFECLARVVITRIGVTCDDANQLAALALALRVECRR
jgi:hypothetical protein